MKICGIDPGNKGAMCVLDTNDLAHPAIFDLEKPSIYDACNWLFLQQVDLIYLEDVHSLFGMSAKSNFNFGKSLGIVTTISQIVTKGVLAKTVTPKVWQKFVGVTAKNTPKDKNAIKKNVAAITAALYPSINMYGPKGGLRDGIPDAAMIAHYGLHHKDL